MKKLPFLIIFIILQSCVSQTKSVDLNDLKFNSIFAQDEKDSTHVYCLLGTGFFRTPSSENSDHLIKTWLETNKNARVTIISTLMDEKSNISYLWLTDSKGETINEYLIRNGCFPGGTMERPKTYNEMSANEKEIWGGLRPNVQVHIDEQSYRSFINKIQKAESFARENKLGIWKNK